MRLRKLNEKGMLSFNAFLDSLTSDKPLPYPKEILIDDSTSEPVEPEIIIDNSLFNNRFEAAQYLNSQLSDTGITNIERDKGLWTWLSLFWFNQLCPPDKNNVRKPGERARWIPETTNFRKYYRHLLLGPYLIYRAHREKPKRALVLLCTPLHQPGDIVEQLASRQELVTCAAIVEAATNIYVDASTNKPKRGVAGRGPGSARRLAEVLNQFDVTWDIYSVNSHAVLAMLPKEFDRFKRVIERQNQK